jgi:short-subunit dehydrogenase
MGMLPYAWSKQALLSLGQGLQGELAGSGVDVFTICPGVVLTGLATELAESFMGGTSTAAAAAVPELGSTGAASCVQPVVQAAAAAKNAGAGPVAVTGEDVLKKRVVGAVDVMPEEALKQKLSAMTAEEAAAYICHGLAGGKVRCARTRSMIAFGMLGWQASKKVSSQGCCHCAGIADFEVAC